MQSMDYLALKQMWWLLLAFAIGLVVGWLSCGRVENDQG
jgi:hypothetical protein